MRLQIICSLENESIPINYRKSCLSLIKTAIEKQDQRKFHEFFDQNTQKYYTWSVYLKNAVFGKEEILVPNKELIFNFSTGDAETAVLFQNAFANLLDEEVPFARNKVTVQSVIPVSQPMIRGQAAIFRTASPIIAREHDRETMKDWFHSVSQNEAAFLETLKANTLYKWEDFYGDSLKQDLEALVFKPIKMKKTVVQHYEKYIEASIGTFRLEGKPYLLNLFLSSGWSSLSGSGFGMLDLVEEVAHAD
ncbi:CRISPR-associated endoribonuclease Cas6 [Enterococcus sp. 669A]|uniref:CRISPR-associated endoribonuclease Cas6 n=1 Tax=Candidatus Enterococcus moelleringii TaxID=2815325 RepID=A0ABS3L570_9ENTE|nr:CRISPR-associated endoribonuclease Cas6 [Enterococcus sp. 669A]